MRSAGSLNHRVELQQRALDANEERMGPWEKKGERWSELTNLLGSEPVMAQRLQGVQPAVVAMRADELTRTIDNSWRLVDVNGRQVREIASATLTKDRAWVEVLTKAAIGDVAPII